MDQLKTLLWKDFVWCKRHPIRTAFFYLLPLFCASFMFITFGLQDSYNSDCDFESFALPPSKPLYVLASLACNRGKLCGNQQEDYRPFWKLFDGFHERHKKNESSMLCPGLSREDWNMTMLRALKPCKIDKPKDIAYDDYTEEDLIYTGHLLYYPKNKDTKKILKYVSERMEPSTDIAAMAPADDDEESMEEMKKKFENVTEHILVRSMQEVMMSGLCFKKIRERTHGFKNREQAMKFALKMNLSEAAPWAMLEFNKTGRDFQYKVIVHLGQRYRKHTLVLQSLVDHAVIQHLTGRKPDVHLEMKRLPKRCHKNPFVLDSANQTIGMVVTLGFIVLAQTLASEICFEKASGLLDFLMIAGVAKRTVRVSWFIFGLFFSWSVCTVVALFFYYVEPVLLDQTAFSLLLVVSLLYGLSILLFCFAIANLMPTAQRASISVLVLLFVCYLVPRWGIMIQAVGYTGIKAMLVRIFSLLFGPIAIQIAYAYIFIAERDAKPIKWSTIFVSPEADDEVCGLGEMMILMVVQCIVYFILSTDLVSWCMAFSFKKKVHKKSEEDGVTSADVEPLLSGNTNEPGIQIDGLVKQYGNKKLAVNQLSVTFYKNQITAFLGHNGAGKSTTMNILTGMFGPTDGTAYIDGKDILSDMTEIRKTLGYCPQHDIIYPDLTVAEHMTFYGDLKRLPRDRVQLYANQIFIEMGMNSSKDQNTLSRNLSGGNKRKLSIAVAFLGDPTTIVLDEPTSAIDPFSRRAIWDVILRYRSKSTLLISTHYMQEADLLGDRIAIIDEGMLKCYGSPMYLKAKFGSGSFLKVAHDSPIDSKSFETKLREFVPLSLVTSTATESSYALPLASVRSAEMIEALKYIEGHQEDHGIVSFGISESTMEQVFFNVTSEAMARGTEGVIPEQNAGIEDHALLKIQKTNKTGFGLLVMQFWATWIKRWDLIKRSKAAFVFQILLPLAFSGLMLFFTSIISEKAAPTTEMLMHPWSLGWNKTFIAYTGKQDSAFVDIAFWIKHQMHEQNCTKMHSSVCAKASCT